MSYGTGVGDLEARVRNLELRAYSPEIANLEARVAALAQARFQGAGLADRAGGAIPVVRLTTSVGPMSGTTPGSGSGYVQTYSGTTVADDTSQLVAVRNITDRTIASGAYVLALEGGGYYWVATPDKCSNLS